MKIEFTWDQAREAAKLIPTNERISSVIFFIGFAVGFWYILALKKHESKFFTSSFNSIDEIALYSFWLVWIITAGLEGILGLRWWSRLFDSFGGILVAALACIWLFGQISLSISITYRNCYPSNGQWLLAWISNTLGKNYSILKLYISFGGGSLLTFCL